jgi:transcriptional repressor NrdR
MAEGFACPSCGNRDTQVKDSRPAKDGSQIRRRRRYCVRCELRWSTLEVREEILKAINIRKQLAASTDLLNRFIIEFNAIRRAAKEAEKISQ